MILLTILFLIPYQPVTQAIEKTVCDCSTPENVGVLNIPEQRCDIKPIKPTTYAVEYTARSEMQEVQQINAYICATWKNIKHTTMNIFGQTITVRDKLVTETSEEECQIIYKTKKCNHEAMTPDGNLWTYDIEPEEQYAWMRTLTYHTIGCSVEEVKLDLQEEKTSLETPLGPVPSGKTSYSHNHLIIVLENNRIITSYKQPSLLLNGTGTITQHLKEGKLILEDAGNQISFHLTNPNNCAETLCTSYKAQGNKQVTITIKRLAQEVRGPLPPTNAYIRNLSEKFKQQLQLSLQYINDKTIANENELLLASIKTKCEIRKAKHQRALSTAQYNGWLAANHLQLKTCIKLNAYGKTLVAIQCKPVTVDFKTEITKCGPQPKYGNYTINLDGWELVKYSPCYWTNGFVNFNDVAHVYQNNTWIVLNGTFKLPETMELKEVFDFVDIKHFVYDHDTNPGYTKNLNSHMNIIADMTATMHEHSEVQPGNQHKPDIVSILMPSLQRNRMSSLSDWIETAKTIVFIVIISIAGIIILRCCYACGLCTILCKICKKCKRNETSRRNYDDEYNEVEMQTMSQQY